MIDSRLQQLVARVLRVPAGHITEDTRHEDLSQWDSLSHLNLIMAIEEDYCVRFPSDWIARLTSIKALRDALDQLIQ